MSLELLKAAHPSASHFDLEQAVYEALTERGANTADEQKTYLAFLSDLDADYVLSTGDLSFSQDTKLQKGLAKAAESPAAVFFDQQLPKLHAYRQGLWTQSLQAAV